MKRVLAGIVLSVAVMGCGGAETTPATPGSIGSSATVTNLPIRTPTLIREPAPTRTPDSSPMTPTPLRPAAVTPIPTQPLLLEGENLLPEGAILRLGGSFPNSGIVSPDGQYRALGGATGMKLYHNDTGEMVWSALTGDVLTKVSFSADGTQVAGLVRGTLLVWDVATGDLAFQFPDSGMFVLDYVWSPNDHILAAIEREQNEPLIEIPTRLVLWSTDTGQAVKRLVETTHPLERLRWLPDDSAIVATWFGNHIGEVLVWDAKTGEPRFTLVGEAPNHLAFSPDWTRLAVSYGESRSDAGGPVGIVIVWDMLSGSELYTLDAPGVMETVWSPNGLWLATAEVWDRGAAGTAIRVWDASTGEVIYLLDPSNQDHASQHDASWSPDNRWLATGVPGAIVIWDIQTGQEFRVLDGTWYRLEWSADSRFLNDGFRRWDIATGQSEGIPRPRTSGLSSTILDLDWSSDGSAIAIGGWGQAGLWDINTGSNVYLLALADPPIHPAATLTHAIDISPDGAQLVTAGGQFGPGALIVWNARTGQRISVLEASEDRAFYDASWSPDGATIAAASTGGISLWNPQEGTSRQLPSADARAVAWSPSGTRLAAVANESFIIWDTTTWDVVRRFELPGHEPLAVAWSPDSRLLAAGARQGNSLDRPGIILVWDVESGEMLYSLEGQPQGVVDLAWSPDGTLLATAGGSGSASYGGMSDAGTRDGTLLLWNMRNGELVRVLYGHTAEVEAVAFSPDGSLLASGSADGTVLIWDVP